MRTFRIATYGTLMAGERNERWAQDALERVPCVIRGWLYDTGWGYPAFVPDCAAGQEVASELLTVTEATRDRMDFLEGFPSLYRREDILALADGQPVKAQVYVMNRLPDGARHIGCGDWREYRRNIGNSWN